MALHILMQVGFAGNEGVFGMLALGDVVDHDNQFAGVIVVVGGQRLGGDGRPDGGAVFAAQFGVALVGE
jgi:hypothetical protein